MSLSVFDLLQVLAGICIAEDGVAAVEAMQDDPVWIPILAEVASTEWAGGDQAKGSSSLLNVGVTKKWGTVLPNSLGLRVAACFKSLVSPFNLFWSNTNICVLAQAGWSNTNICALDIGRLQLLN